ncbi:hypothetical protein [Nocardia carnea]|uniref:hypothetical protein n=1 Tax=Nocardia carnea TaxID=37328 RepID=UPI002453DD19|nr:hypothetical protein [Nocardia carnea]
MWHWTTRTGQYPEAVAFTRRVAEPEPTVTERVPETETETGETEAEDIRGGVCAGHFDLAG